jgi:hypothetical protein
MSGNHIYCQDVVCRVPKLTMQIGKVTQPPPQTVTVKSEPIHVDVPMPVAAAPRVSHIEFQRDRRGRLSGATAT